MEATPHPGIQPKPAARSRTDRRGLSARGLPAPWPIRRPGSGGRKGERGAGWRSLQKAWVQREGSGNALALLLRELRPDSLRSGLLDIAFQAFFAFPASEKLETGELDAVEEVEGGAPRT